MFASPFPKKLHYHKGNVCSALSTGQFLGLYSLNVVCYDEFTKTGHDEFVSISV